MLRWTHFSGSGLTTIAPVDLPDTTGLESVYLRSRTQPNPVPSPPSPCCAERKPEPIVDGEPKPAAVDEPSQHGAKEAEDRHGADADCDVRPGARAGYNARHEGASRGQWERGEERSPLHRGWGWAEFGSGTAGLRRRGCGCGCWLAPSPPTLFGALSHSCFPILPRKRLSS